MLQYIQLSEPFADWYFPNEQSGQFITSGVPFPVWKVLQHIKCNLIYISWWHLGRIEIFHLDISCSCWASLYLLNKFQLDRKYSLKTRFRTGKCQADIEDMHRDPSCQFLFDKFQQHTKYSFDWDQSFPYHFDIDHTRKISSCFHLHSLHYFDTFLPGRGCRLKTSRKKEAPRCQDSFLAGQVENRSEMCQRRTYCNEMNRWHLI